jgi:hypothetical protein
MARFPESWNVRGRGSPEMPLKDGSRRAHLFCNLVPHAGLAPQQWAKQRPKNVRAILRLFKLRRLRKV